jgi:GTP cyclohydrolase II
MITRFSEAKLPTPHGEFRVVVYRTGEAAGLGGTALGAGPEEHVAMVFGDVRGDAVLCRVHSSCFTGEVLGSLRCDCRAQLDAALARIAEEGRGVVVYLVQEGRGIGLGNKVAAYRLQDDGRNYDLAAGILRDLGVTSVRLMTNNPQKIAGLETAGMVVTAESHWVGESAHSESYLATKKSKLGHLS